MTKSNDHDNEGRVLTLEFEKFSLVTVYIPNIGEKVPDTKDEF